jgi:hypothetical protein
MVFFLIVERGEGVEKGTRDQDKKRKRKGTGMTQKEKQAY